MGRVGADVLGTVGLGFSEDLSVEGELFVSEEKNAALETALAAVQEGDPKPIMKWFLPFGKYVFVPLCLLCFVLGIAWGGIG